VPHTCGREASPRPPRRLRAMRTACLVALILVVACGRPCLSDGWAMWGADEARSRRNPEPFTPGIAHWWSFPARGLTRAAPVAAGDRAFFGSDDGSVYAVSISSGRLLWRFSPLSRVRAAPAAASDSVYVAAHDSRLYSLDARTGWLNWQFDAASWITGAPVVADGTVFFATYSGTVYAVDAATGSVKWTFAVGDDFLPWGPAMEGDAVFLATLGGDALALDASDGELLWRTPLAANPACGPAVDGDLFMVLTRGNGSSRSWQAIRVSGADGRIVWRRPLESAGPWSAPALLEDAAVVATPGSATAVDLETGRVVWEWSSDSPGARSRRTAFPPCSAGSYVLVLADGGSTAVMLDPASGRKVWETDLGVPAVTPPSVHGGTVLLGGSDRRAYCYGPMHIEVDGKLVPFDGPWPAVAAGRLVVPVRPVFEALGADVLWHDTGVAVIVKGDRFVQIWPGVPRWTVDGRSPRLDIPVRMAEGRLMVGLRPVAEALGATVVWSPRRVRVLSASSSP